MKSLNIKPTLIVTLITLCTTAILSAQSKENTKPEEQQPAVEHPDLKAFPPPEAGMERFVIVLPKKEEGEEDNFKVELLPGKIMETDGNNLYSFGDILKQKSVKGWAYSFYECIEGPVKMTLMRPGPNPVEKFVSGHPLHIRYISRLPIVIYAPAGFEIRYRIWKADENFTTAPKG